MLGARGGGSQAALTAENKTLVGQDTEETAVHAVLDDSEGRKQTVLPIVYTCLWWCLEKHCGVGKARVYCSPQKSGTRENRMRFVWLSFSFETVEALAGAMILMCV